MEFPVVGSVPSQIWDCILNFEDGPIFLVIPAFNPISISKAFVANILGGKRLEKSLPYANKVIQFIPVTKKKRSYWEKSQRIGFGN